MHILVRTDLPLADQCVQACHAGIRAGMRFAPPDDCPLVLLGVPDRATLEDYALRAAHAGIARVIFDEPDDGMGHTALCTEPLTREAGRLFRRLPLWSGRCL